MKNWIILGLLGVGGFYFYRRMQLPKRIKVLFRKLSLSGGSLLSPKVTIELGVQNPTGTQTNIRSIVGTLTVGKRSIADISSFQNFVIKPNQETRIKIEANIRSGAVVQEILDLISGQNKNIIVNLSGTVNAEGFSIPLNIDYRF